MKTNKTNSDRFIFLSSLILLAIMVLPTMAQNTVEPIIVKDKNVQIAVDLYNKGDYIKAESFLREIINKDEKNADAHYALAIQLSTNNKLYEALVEAKNAVDLNSNNAEYHYILARLYILKINDVNIFRKLTLAKSSEQELLASLKIDPAHKNATISLINFYLQAPSIAGGDKDKAIKLANSSINSNEIEGRKLLSQIYLALKDYIKAAEEANKLIKIDEYSGRFMLIQIFKMQNNTNKAIFEYDKIESRFGNNPEYFAFYNDYGYFLMGQKQFDRAIDKFKKQVALVPNSADAHDSLGEGYLAKGLLKESLVEYNKAIDLDPNLANAKDKIEEIKDLMNK